MDIVIGIRDSQRELQLETDASLEDVRTQVEAAYKNGAEVLWLTDSKGRQVGVPVSTLAYIELLSTAGSRRVGFGPS